MLKTSGELRSISDAIAIPIRVFANTDTAVGKLLQYGTESVTEFLKGGFDKFSEGLPTIDPRTPKPIEDIQKELNLGISALHELMTGFEDVGQALQALKFVNTPLHSNGTKNNAKLRSTDMTEFQERSNCGTTQLLRRFQATSGNVGNEKSRVSDHNSMAI